MPNISYIEEGTGEVILFLHGWGQNKEMMFPLIDELKNNYRCILIDLPGFGKSEFNGSKNLEEYTVYLRNFLECRNIIPRHIVGHSFGGKLALNYYLKYKDINSLTFIASPILRPKRGIKYYLKIYAYKLMKRLKINTCKKGSEDYRNCSKNMKSFFVNVVNRHFNKEIKNIKVPTLLLWGDKDEKVPLNKAKKIRKKIKCGQLVVEKGGHFAYLENIEFTRLIIQQFLRRCKGD